MDIGKRVYFDTKTGEVILNTGERSGWVVQTTIEDDIRAFKVLSERNRDTFDFLEFEYGAHREQESIGGYVVGVELETKSLIFEYPTPDEQPPVVTTENPFDSIRELKEENTTIKASMAELAELVLGGM